MSTALAAPVRAHAIGDAISFVTPEDHAELRALERFIGRGIVRKRAEGFRLQRICPGARACRSTAPPSHIQGSRQASSIRPSTATAWKSICRSQRWRPEAFPPFGGGNGRARTAESASLHYLDSRHFLCMATLTRERTEVLSWAAGAGFFAAITAAEAGANVTLLGGVGPQFFTQESASGAPESHICEFHAETPAQIADRQAHGRFEFGKVNNDGTGIGSSDMTSPMDRHVPHERDSSRAITRSHSSERAEQRVTTASVVKACRIIGAEAGCSALQAPHRAVIAIRFTFPHRHVSRIRRCVRRRLDVVARIGAFVRLVFKFTRAIQTRSRPCPRRPWNL